MTELSKSGMSQVGVCSRALTLRVKYLEYFGVTVTENSLLHMATAEIIWQFGNIQT